MFLSLAVAAFALARLAALVLVVRVAVYQLVLAALLLGTAASCRLHPADRVAVVQVMWLCQAVVVAVQKGLWCVLVLLVLLVLEEMCRYAVADAVLRPAATRLAI